MDFILNVLAGLVTGIIVSTFVATRKSLSLYLRFGRVRKVWFPFLRGNAVVVITGRPGQLPRSTTKVSFSEVLALVELKAFFQRFGSNFDVLNSIDANPSQYADKDIILLGSQQANEETELISRKIAVPFSYDDHGNLVSQLGRFPSIPDDGTLLKEDHALILKCNSPYGHARKVLILAGNHGTATESAVRYMVSPSGIVEIASKLGSSDFIGILHVDVESNVPKSYKLVTCWKFEEVVNHR